MARARDYRAEAARRNRLAREAGFRNYYEQRIARARKQNPRITRRAARGHGTPAEREANKLVRAIRRLPKDGMVAFTGIDRRPDGTWDKARFDLLGHDVDEHFILDDTALYQLSHIADVIADMGIMVLGAKYLAKMQETTKPKRRR